ncbi:MAG: DUF11 domain-containing protein [Candidatus Eremiobacteraeota bacterium]|nr:DUF11 domain-containing protein [Candidatus Eremiobacteraeota bacterium]
MRTLNDVFAPETPLLPEGLRTLVVSPGRVVEPGQTVHATFTFRNLGGGTATGFRARFRLPEGLTYLVGTASIDGTPVDEQGGLTTLLQSSGCDIGDIAPGSERRISLAYTVAPTIENGTPITLQAAISSFEVPLIGSNVVRLVVRSKPQLKNPQTKLTAVAVRETAPGQELQLKAQVHNSGQSSAHDLIVLLPVPANTAYVDESASVGGHPAGGHARDPFGYGRPAVTVPTLGPGTTIDVSYRVRIDPVVEDGCAIAVTAAVCSQEVPEFSLTAVTLKVPSAPTFAGGETEFRAECEDEVVPGQRVALTLRARNGGTAIARQVRLAVELPDGLVYVPGSRSVNGAPAADRETDGGAFLVGDLVPGRSVEVALTAVVAVPQPDGHEIPLGASVEWSKGRRHFERTVTVRSAPLFPAAFNDVVRESARRLEPGDAAVATVHLANLGTDVATDVRLVLDADAGLEGLRASEGDKELPVRDDGAIQLDTLEPGRPRTVRVEARVASTMEDETQVRLRASLRTAQLDPIEIGSAAHVVASRPRFSAKTSKLELADNEVLRPNRTTTCRLVLMNKGTDAGRDVRVRLQLPEELRLESVEGASRDGHHVVFGEVPAGESREAKVHLRLVTTITHGDVLEVSARVAGINVVPFALDTMRVATHAEPDFSHDVTLVATPDDAIDAGAELTYTLSLRNAGDGAAKRLTARIEAPGKTVYAPGSTTVNDVPLLDFAGTSPLLTPSGLTLADVGPGVEVIARLRVIVNTPLPAGTTIEARALIGWDEVPEIAVHAEPVRVRSQAAFPISAPSLPFSVLDAAAALEARPSPRPLPQAEPTLRLPPATPVRANGAGTYANGPTALTDQAERVGIAVWVDLTADRLDWLVPYLREARFPGLLPHLMLLRALFPDGAEDADAVMRARLRRHGELMSDVIDTLFVKLRLPGADTSPSDFESRELRASLRGVLDALRRPRPHIEDIEPAEVRLVGAVRYNELGAAVEALEKEPLSTATPWLALSLLMGARLERDGETVAEFGPYREALQRALAELGRLTPDEFLAAVSRPVDPTLDERRDDLVDAIAEQLEAPA